MRRRIVPLFAMTLVIAIMLTGCTAGVGQRVNSGKVNTTALGHSTLVTDADSLAVTAAGEAPFYTVFGDETNQVEMTGAAPSSVVSLSIGGTTLGVGSPKDTIIRGAEVTTPEGVTIIFDELSTDISTPTQARAAVISLLAEVYKQISEDEREKFKAQMDTVEAGLGAVIEAAAGVAERAISPIP